MAYGTAPRLYMVAVGQQSGWKHQERFPKTDLFSLPRAASPAPRGPPETGWALSPSADEQQSTAIPLGREMVAPALARSARSENADEAIVAGCCHRNPSS